MGVYLPLKIFLPAGDEMRLRHSCPSAGTRGPWHATGLVVRLDDASEEVALELKQEAKPPTDTTVVSNVLVTLHHLCCSNHIMASAGRVN